MPKRIPTAAERIPAPSTLPPPPDTVAPVSPLFTRAPDEQRDAIRQALITLVLQIREQWDAERQLELLLGFDVKDISQWPADWAIPPGRPTFTDREIDEFLAWARRRQDGPDHDPSTPSEQEA